MLRLLAAVALVLIVAGCARGGGSEPSEADADRLERLEEELSTLPDLGPGGGEAVAVPFSTLLRQRRIRVEVGGHSLVVRWRSGVASSLDSGSVAEGRDVGAAEVREGERLVTFDEPFWFAVAAFRPDVRIVRSLRRTGS